MTKPACWGDEDGDWYFYEAHVDLEAMRLKAIAFEEECGCYDDERAEFIAAGEISHSWVRWDPDDDEAPGERVSENTPGAVPITRLG